MFGDLVAHDLDLCFEGKSSNRDNLDRLNVIISRTMRDRANNYCKHGNVGFRSVYLHLTMSHSRGQTESHAHFDCE